MKTIVPALIVAVLLAGCSAEEKDLVPKAQPVAPPASITPVVSLPAPAPHLPPPGTATPAPPPQAQPFLSTDGDNRAQLAEKTERVYMKWNAALAAYTKQNQRPPSSLADLEKFQPELAANQAPPGFKLLYDPQIGEVLVTHATAQMRHK